MTDRSAAGIGLACRRGTVHCLVGVAVLVLPGCVAGPTAAPAKVAAPGEVVNDSPRPVLEVPYAAVKPKMGASAADPAWTAAAKIPALGLSLGPGAKGKTASPTEVRLLWDRDYLYVRFLCTDDEIYAPYTGRDANHYEGDVVEIFFDPVGDHLQYFELQVSPRNEILDQLILVTGRPRYTPSGTFAWDFVGKNVWYFPDWTVKGFRTAAGRLEAGGKEVGWLVDAAIPARETLKRLGARTFSPMTLRINFIRYNWRPGADGKRHLTAMNWAPVLWGCPHVSPKAMGYIKLLPPPGKS